MRMIAGWKTKFGYLIVAIGVGLYIASLWHPDIPDKISAGVIIFGAATMFYGYCNRFNRAFYMIDEKGNPDTKRSKLKNARMREGEL